MPRNDISVPIHVYLMESSVDLNAKGTTWQYQTSRRRHENSMEAGTCSRCIEDVVLPRLQIKLLRISIWIVIFMCLNMSERTRWPECHAKGGSTNYQSDMWEHVLWSNLSFSTRVHVMRLQCNMRYHLYIKLGKLAWSVSGLMGGQWGDYWSISFFSYFGDLVYVSYVFVYKVWLK
jgi:hypothetical protein